MSKNIKKIWSNAMDSKFHNVDSIFLFAETTDSGTYCKSANSTEALAKAIWVKVSDATICVD